MKIIHLDLLINLIRKIYVKGKKSAHLFLFIFKKKKKKKIFGKKKKKKKKKEEGGREKICSALEIHFFRNSYFRIRVSR